MTIVVPPLCCSVSASAPPFMVIFEPFRLSSESGTIVACHDDRAVPPLCCSVSASNPPFMVIPEPLRPRATNLESTVAGHHADRDAAALLRACRHPTRRSW